MSKLTMTPQKQYNAQMLNDPNRLNAYTMQRYGMSAADVEQALRINTALARGRMPEGDQLKWLYDAAKQKYGWGSERVRSELNSILQLPTPEARIHGYLHAGGNVVAPEMVREVIGLVESYSQTEMEQSLIDRVNANPSISHLDNRQGEMPANPRAKESAEGRTNIRDILKGQLGDSTPRTYAEARERIQRAGLRLADRMDANEARDMMDIANGREPQGLSLRDELSMQYDLEKVASAREAYGFGDLKGDAETFARESTGHLDERFDVTEDIRDL